MTETASRRRLSWLPVVLVVLAGLGIRALMASHTAIVNPDGVLYIHQARAIFHGQWRELTSCGLSFVSGYPFLIAGLYHLTSDWITAARLVSILLGTLTLIPLYGILIRFLKKPASILCLLVVALTPALVSNSAEVVREPMMWFCGISGMYLVLRYTDRPKPFLLVGSGILFMTAAWARMEALLLIPASVWYLLFFGGPGRIRRIAWFLFPIAVGSLAILWIAWCGTLSAQQMVRGKEIVEKSFLPLVPYENLRTELRELSRTPGLSPDMGRFLPEVRNAVWLVGLFTLANRIMEAFFYPFLPLYVAGFVGLWHRMRFRPDLAYLMITAALGLLLLYIHTMQTWMIYYRFLGIVLLSSAVLAGYGLQWALDKWERFRAASGRSALVWLTLLILLAGLPKNCWRPDPDKAVFVEIGRTIAERHPPHHEKTIATSVHTQQWISFYANLDVPGAPNPGGRNVTWERFPRHPLYFLITVKEKRIDYVLWEENNWPARFLPPSELLNSRFFRAVGSWNHPDTGRMILYEVIR